METTRSIHALVLALPVCALACGGSKGNPSTPGPPDPAKAEVVIDIVGAGTVTFDQASVAPCTSTGSSAKCPAITFQSAGSATATPAVGWRLVGWSATFGNSSPNALTNPENATQIITPGTSVALTVTFKQFAHPIKATFTQQTFSTAYAIDIDNPDFDFLKVVWSGPNCGEFFPPGEVFGSDKANTFTMTWKHPHPPCDLTTNHSDVKVQATITIRDRIHVCEYQGSDTGEGPPVPCKKVG